MSVSLVVLRLELAETSPVPGGFPYSAAGGSRAEGGRRSPPPVLRPCSGSPLASRGVVSARPVDSWRRLCKQARLGLGTLCTEQALPRPPQPPAGRAPGEASSVFLMLHRERERNKQNMTLGTTTETAPLGPEPSPPPSCFPPPLDPLPCEAGGQPCSHSLYSCLPSSPPPPPTHTPLVSSQQPRRQPEQGWPWELKGEERPCWVALR